MASRSRHFTRHDPEGRFSPLTTAEQIAEGERVLASMAEIKKPLPRANVELPPIFSAREAAPWLGLLGIGGP
ncbi:hypothetical protein ACWC0A_30655 [Streptomyces scopuliridis]